MPETVIFSTQHPYAPSHLEAWHLVFAPCCILTSAITPPVTLRHFFHELWPWGWTGLGLASTSVICHLTWLS